MIKIDFLKQLPMSMIYTSVFYILNRFVFKSVNSLLFYIYMFLMFLFIQIFNPISAIEVVKLENRTIFFESYSDFQLYQSQIGYLENKILTKDLTPLQRQEYTDEMNLHKREGIRNLKNVEEACLFAPNKHDRTLGESFWTAACAFGFTPGTLTTRFCAALGVLAADFGISAMKHYNYIHDQMLWAQYHAEQYEWYKYVLENA